MNVFVLDLDPQKCAEYHCNKHLVKMITEHNQILGSIAYTARGIQRKKEITPEFVKQVFQGFPRKHADGSPNPYGIGYANHPCTKWAADSKENYEWLCELNIRMCQEYTLRYGRIHAGELITNFYAKNAPKLPSRGMTKFAQAMPEDCKNEYAPTAYRNYYIKHKAQFAKWPADRVPHWWPNPTENETKTV
jgi:hypothetical protein